MMLSSALSEMIDHAECIMFYNTPQSIVMVDDLNTIKKSNKKVTLSPWIYHELAMTYLIKRSTPKRKINVPVQKSFIEHRAFNEDAQIDIEYDVDSYLKDMISLTSQKLRLWKKENDIINKKENDESIFITKKCQTINPLDILYGLVE